MVLHTSKHRGHVVHSLRRSQTGCEDATQADYHDQHHDCPTSETMSTCHAHSPSYPVFTTLNSSAGPDGPVSTNGSHSTIQRLRWTCFTLSCDAAPGQGELPFHLRDECRMRVCIYQRIDRLEERRLIHISADDLDGN